MSGPPDDVPAGDLFDAIHEPRFSEVVKFPRKTPTGKEVQTVRIQVLPMREHTNARKTALKKAESQHKLSREEQETELGRAIVNDLVARELLAVACRSETNHGAEDKPFYPVIFQSGEQVDDRLSADELAVLFNLYLLVQNKYGPFEKTIQTEEELNAWIKRLVEGAAEHPLGRLSSVHWAELASLLARRAYTLSAILGSLRSILPPTLVSRLETYFLDITSSGSRAASTSGDGSGISPSLKILDVEITIEDARDMALRMRDAEAGVLAALDEAERNRD